VYYILGDWNKLDDQNTLIDTGVDDYLISHIKNTSTGIGQKKVAQVIITHEHFDHKGGLKYIKEAFNPVVYAYNKDERVDVKVFDGQKVVVGDAEAILYHTPGHSNDSICVYVPSEGVLFCGDLPLGIHSWGGTYTLTYLNTLRKLAELDVQSIYPGHGEPVLYIGSKVIKETLNLVEQAKIIE